jgi:hypothetical protein
MRAGSSAHEGHRHDTWLEEQCMLVHSAGIGLAEAVGEVNQRTLKAIGGELGRQRRVTSSQIRAVEQAHVLLADVQDRVQNALFDCEHELRALREQELTPAELVLEGGRLIALYRFFRRRARILDGMLAYLPETRAHAGRCLDSLRRLRDGTALYRPLTVPDCGFALVALDELRGDSPAGS